MQLKSTQDRSALASITSIIKALQADYDYKVCGHEVHQTRGVIAKTTVQERARQVSQFCAKNEITHLAYHAPILGRGQNIWEKAKEKKVKESLALTIKEAAMVRQEAGISGKVTVVFHLTTYVKPSMIPRTMQEKMSLFERAEREFVKVVEDHDHQHHHHQDSAAGACVLAVENVYPRYDKDSASIGPFHPDELVRMKRHGVKAALDIAHYHAYASYLRHGKGNPVGDLDRRAYGQAPTWDQCIKTLSDSLVLLHISNARGFTPKGEGLLPSEGDVPLLDVLREANRAGKTLQGTLELTDGHLHNSRLQLQGARWLMENARDLF